MTLAERSKKLRIELLEEIKIDENKNIIGVSFSK